MKEKVEEIRTKLDEAIKEVESINLLGEVKTRFLGKKGLITELTSNMKDLAIEERKEIGRISNELKKEVTEKLDELSKSLEEKSLNEKLEKEKIDVTLPATKVRVGTPNILEKVTEELEELLMSMGYDVVEGPEVEKDLYNFELLNLPKGHPARDAQDTFYIEGDTLLLRSQTSPVQIRTMLENTEKSPIRIICPGKTYRRDDDDATHSHQFTQMEGLLVDKDISLADLKGTFDIIAKKMFGDASETRFRPSFYPFTEPSVEMDISCFNCNGDGCNICKNTGWITIGGAGVVHYNVLSNCGYDPEKYSGFAFGFGIERIAMLKYGINDIRTFYTNDLRINPTFNRKESD